MAAGKAGSKWQKIGKSGADPSAPGSYGGYVKPRTRPSGYPTTAKQRLIGSAGRRVGEECKGKEGSAFKKCRHDIMVDIFKLPK